MAVQSTSLAQPPAVSVVITCYNLEPYIGAAIESVLAQDYGGPVELIVVDDCSTDASADVIRAFPEAKTVRTPANRGVLLAMLSGADEATRDLIFFLDGDDVWEVDKLARCVDAFVASPRLGFVTHDLRYAGAGGQPIDRATRVEAVLGKSAQDGSSQVREGILQLADYVWLGSAMSVRKSLIRFDDFVRFARSLPDPRNTYQDWPLAYWIAVQDDIDLGYVPEKLFRYRLHDLNHSGDASTVDRALRNLRRTLNTNLAIAEIARQFDAPQRSRRAIERRLAVNRYLLDLMGGARQQAATGFLRSVPDFLTRGLMMKELARFFAVQLLGPQRFTSLASRRSVARDLPVT